MSVKPIKLKPKMPLEYEEEAERLKRLRELRRKKVLERLKARESIGLEPTERQKEEVDKEMEHIIKRSLLKNVVEEDASRKKVL